MDFPIPGSPPRRIRLPLTMPPPRTLSSSLTPVLYLCSSSVDISVIFIALLYDETDLPLDFKEVTIEDEEKLLKSINN